MQQGNHWELYTFRINPTRNSGLGFGGRANYSRVSHVKLKKKIVITNKWCLICPNICRIRPCAVFLMPEDYIMFFWFSFCSKNVKHNTFFMTQVTLCFPTEQKKNLQQNWLIKDFYLSWESNVVSLSHM